MKKITLSVFLTLLIVAAVSSNSHATSTYQTRFRSTYPSAVGSVIDNCTLCHPGGNTGSLNSYANAYRSAGHAFAPIEPQDSDGDSFTNIAEINAKTYPGDSASKPGTPPANRPPVANAGVDKTTTSGGSVTLTGSGSDPDGNPITYAWTQTGGAPNVALSGANTATASFTAPTVTSSTVFTFQLTVRDNGNLTATDVCLVTVNPAGTNRPPVANAGTDMTVASGARVTLTGSGSDPDGNPITYAWTQTGGSTAVALSGASTASASFIAPTVTSSAALTFQLTVKDSGNLSATDTILVTVRPAGPAPTGKPPVANAGLDMMVLPGTFIHLEGFYSSDPDDGIASYAWSQTAGPSVTLSDPAAMDPIFQAPYTPTTLTFRLVVTDKGGLQSSDTCTVVVLSP